MYKFTVVNYIAAVLLSIISFRFLFVFASKKGKPLLLALKSDNHEVTIGDLVDDCINHCSKRNG